MKSIWSESYNIKSKGELQNVQEAEVVIIGGGKLDYLQLICLKKKG